MNSKRELGRQQSPFGKYLTELRERNKLSKAAAARELTLGSRQQLFHYESGRTLPSVPILIKISQLYKRPPEEVLERAFWPQLVLLPLITIIEPNQIPPNFIEELEKGLYEAERRKLTQYIEKLLRKRPAMARR